MESHPWSLKLFFEAFSNCDQSIESWRFQSNQSTIQKNTFLYQRPNFSVHLSVHTYEKTINYNEECVSLLLLFKTIIFQQIFFLTVIVENQIM